MRLIDADALQEYLFNKSLFSAIMVKAIENMPTVNPYEWISVEDRLPEEHTDVLCYYKFEPDSPDIICENTYQGSGHWVSEGDRVTHWMPLLPPPIKKGVIICKILTKNLPKLYA